MNTDRASLGRFVVFLVVKSFRVLGLKANANTRDAEEAYKKIVQKIEGGNLTEDETAELLTEASEAYEVALSLISGPLKPDSKEAALDWERFLGVYNIYMDGKSDEEKEGLKKFSDEVQLSLLDADLMMKPMVYGGKMEVRLREGLATSWAIVILGIPVLVVLWNIHPVLGILGIVWYFWLLRDRWVAGQF